MTDIRATSTPWHLWVIGILALLWNAMGGFDYYMTQTHNEAYMTQFTPEQLAFFYGFPSWVVASWAIAVWGSILGTILLLLRNSLAAPVFLLSLVGMIFTTIHNFILTDGMEIMGGVFPALFTAVIFLVVVGLYFYSNSMKKKGVLT